MTYQAAPIENYIPLSVMLCANPLPHLLPKNLVRDPHQGLDPQATSVAVS